GDAGLVTPEGDVEALQAALLRLATQPDLRETLARKGRERVLAHYTQEEVARKIVGVYHEALAARAEKVETTSA
ncbi:MAG TPA: glycosyltransferase, partial [Ktedonobacterales bacterium]